MDESALEVKGAYESAKVDADAKKREVHHGRYK
jgi:hypothetical protein